jgi:holo-[acyl-carrier protein] synthase
MIKRLGIDLADVNELRASAERQPDKYLQRIFTAAEIAYAESHADPIQCIAGKLAAKEACMKAFGTGWSDVVDWKHIEVLNTDPGQPYLVLHDGAVKQLESLGCR